MVDVVDQPWKRKGKKKSPEGVKNANQSGLEAGHTCKTRPMALNGFLSGRRLRINSAGHPVKSRYFNSNVPRGQQHPMMNGNQARKDGKIYGAGNWTKSRQRSSSEPGDTQSSYKGSPNTVLLVDDSAVVAAPREQNGEAKNQPAPLYWDHNSNFVDVGQANHCDSDIVSAGIVNGHGGYPVMMSGSIQQPAINTTDSSCVSVSAAEQLTQESMLAESPPLLPHHMPTPPQNVVSAVPFFSVMIPVADNLGGTVNVCVSPSVDPTGADLPINDCATMRFFFNIGVQYYHTLAFMQQQQPPALSPLMSYPGPNLCMAAPAGHLVPLETFSGAEDGVVYAGLSPPPPPGMMSAPPVALGSFVPLMPAGPMPYHLPSV